MPGSEPIKASDASRALGVKYYHLWEAITRGALPAARIGPGGRAWALTCSLEEAARILGVEPPEAPEPEKPGRSRRAAA